MNFFNIIFSPLYWLFGFCMSGLLYLFSNEYFVAITFFVILTRVVLLPFSMKQQKTMARTSRIQPKIAKIQKKYAINQNMSQKQAAEARQRMNEEMQNLYARENHNPMSMGCGPMIFQMVFLMGIIGIIYQPLTYVLHVDAADIQAMSNTVAATLGADLKTMTYPELKILENFAAIKDSISPEIASQIQAFKDGMVIGNFDLTAFPSIKEFNALIIVPVLAGLTSLGASLYSTEAQKKSNPAMAQQGKAMNIVMMLIMPLFSVYIAFQVPAAVGIYWSISSVISMLQQMLLNATYSPKKVAAKSMIESTIERRSREKHIISMDDNK